MSPDKGPVAGGNTVSVTQPVGVKIKDVSAGYLHTLALGANNVTYASGHNNKGQLGDGTTTDRTAFVEVNMTKVPANVHFTRIEAGYDNDLAVGSDGNLYAWGDINSSTMPIRVNMPAGVSFTKDSAISIGGGHALAVGSDGVTYAWGSNFWGQLGTGNTAETVDPTPVNAPSGVKFVQVSAGYVHSLAIDTDGRIYGWGADDYGPYLNNTRYFPSKQLSPVAINNPAGVRFSQIKAAAANDVNYTGCTGGDSNTCYSEYALALTDSGDVYSWGSDIYGNLGRGGTPRYGPVANDTTPVKITVPTTSKITQIDSKVMHSSVIDANGRGYSWGTAASGQLGIGEATVSQTTPVAIKMDAGKKFLKISSGCSQKVAITDDNVGWSWGGNIYGELADTTINKGTGSGLVPDKAAKSTPGPIPPALRVDSVTFDGTPGTDLKWDDASSTYKVKTPAHAAGVVDAVITYVHGLETQTATVSYEYLADVHLIYDVNAPAGRASSVSPSPVTVSSGSVAADGSGWTVGDSSKVPGYVFLGWKTTKVGPVRPVYQGVAYADPVGEPEAEGYDFSTVLTRDVTVYAQWKADPQAISYDENGGTGDGNRYLSKGSTDQTVKVAGATWFTRDGYAFTGWNTQADGNGMSYQPGDLVQLPVGGVTLYAQWRIVQYALPFTGGQGLVLSVLAAVVLLAVAAVIRAYRDRRMVR